MNKLPQLVRFAGVATVNLGVNLGVLALGLRVFALQARLGTTGLVLSQAAAVLAATSLGYVLHSRFTFTSARRPAGVGRLGRFWGVALGSLALQVPLFIAIITVLRWLAPAAAGLPYAANILGGAVIFLGSFVANRRWTFQAHSKDDS